MEPATRVGDAGEMVAQPPSLESASEEAKETASGVSGRPHIVLVIPRGEAIRNFLNSETLPSLAAQARVTLLSVVQEESLLGPNRVHADRVQPRVQVIPLPVAMCDRRFVE